MIRKRIPLYLQKKEMTDEVIIKDIYKKCEEEEKERDRICETVFHAITKLKNTEKDRSQIESILKKEKYYLTLFRNYELFILELMHWASRHRKEKEITDSFRYIFYDDLKNSPLKVEIPVIACDLVGLRDVVFESAYDKQFINQLSAYSDLSDELMIVGDTGTGKQFIVRALYLMGNRNKNPLQEINCAAIPPLLLEGELFGYEKGAFTGANEKKQGLLEFAENGIVFLDELGKMSIGLQAKLLKTIQDKKFRRTGGTKDLTMNARFIAAIQPDDLKNNSILPDLKYRLGYPDYIRIPTLNERLKNILPRAVIFSVLNQVKRSMEVEKGIKLKNETVSLLCDYDYKGNYRELYAILRKGLREALMDNRNTILPKDLIDILNTDKTAYVKNSECDLNSIKLKDVLDYADNIKKKIIEKKISDIVKNGKTIRAALSEEGVYQEKDYQNFRKKVVNITGKGLKDLQ